MQIKIINTSTNPDPAYATPHAAGMDLRAFLPEPITLLPMQRVLIPTGLFIELPEGYEAQIRPRSGLAINSGISMVNTPGTIDADYRGEIRVIMINFGDKPFTVSSGDKIAQMVIAPYTKAEWVRTDALSDSERGAGGFGHTGI